MSELRKDPIIGRWVIVAPERGNKPFKMPEKKKVYPSEHCPFCKNNENRTPAEIYSVKCEDTGEWKIRVVPNKLPALKVEGNLERQGLGIYDRINGIGAHEIIIETPEHGTDSVNLDIKHIRDIFITYKRRMLDLSKDQRLKYTMVFKNYGVEAGATIDHSHSQLIAMPVIPKRVKEELEGAQKYFNYKERCIFCDIIYQEIHDNKRVVAEEENFIAIEPFAARFPFETWIIPKIHLSNYEHSSDDLLHHLAIIFKSVMEKINKALNYPPYNFMIHTAPLGTQNIEQYHWHIEIIPRLLHVAGFEWGTGFYINPTSPEDAAGFLKDLKI